MEIQGLEDSLPYNKKDFTLLLRPNQVYTVVTRQSTGQGSHQFEAIPNFQDCREDYMSVY